MQKRDLYYERIPTKLLRDDVRYLGNILGKVIKEQEGKNFFNLVEKVRRLSKANKISLNTKQTNKKLIYYIQFVSIRKPYLLENNLHTIRDGLQEYKRNSFITKGFNNIFRYIVNKIDI